MAVILVIAYSILDCPQDIGLFGSEFCGNFEDNLNKILKSTQETQTKGKHIIYRPGMPL